MTELQRQIHRTLDEIYSVHQEPQDYMAWTQEIANRIGKNTESVGNSLSWMRDAGIVVSIRVKGPSGIHHVWAFADRLVAKGRPDDGSPAARN